MVSQEAKVKLVPQVCPVLPDFKDLPVLRVFLEVKDQVVLRVLGEIQVFQE